MQLCQKHKQVKVGQVCLALLWFQLRLIYGTHFWSRNKEKNKQIKVNYNVSGYSTQVCLMETHCGRTWTQNGVNIARKLRSSPWISPVYKKQDLRWLWQPMRDWFTLTHSAVDSLCQKKRRKKITFPSISLLPHEKMFKIIKRLKHKQAINRENSDWRLIATRYVHHKSFRSRAHAKITLFWINIKDRSTPVIK